MATHKELRELLRDEFKKRDPRLLSFLEIRTVSLQDNSERTEVIFKRVELVHGDPYTPFGYEVYLDEERRAKRWRVKSEYGGDPPPDYTWWVDAEPAEYFDEGNFLYSWGTVEWSLVKDDMELPDLTDFRENVVQFVERVTEEYKVHEEIGTPEELGIKVRYSGEDKK